MLNLAQIDLAAPAHLVAPTSILLRRGQQPPWVVHIDSGKVGVGLMNGDQLEHQLGVLQGPCWLDTGSAILQQPALMDAVAQSEVFIRRIALDRFRSALLSLPSPAQSIMYDMALAYRQQTEMTVSRLVKDAESRCAEWLLRHVQQIQTGEWLVSLSQRKRAIAAQLGIAPETLSRVLRHLRERGLIEGTGRTLTVLQPVELRALAQA